MVLRNDYENVAILKHDGKYLFTLYDSSIKHSSYTQYPFYFSKGISIIYSLIHYLTSTLSSETCLAFTNNREFTFSLIEQQTVKSPKQFDLPNLLHIIYYPLRMNLGQYSTLPQQKNYAYKQSERSKSPINGQTATRDDKANMSPLKYPLYMPNTQQFPYQHKPSTPFHQHQIQKPGTSGHQKQNSRIVVDNWNNHNVQQTDTKISAIDRVIQNCNIMNLNSPTKHKRDLSQVSQATNQNGNGHERRPSTLQTIENYQPFHQQPSSQPQPSSVFQNPYLAVPQQPQVNASQELLCSNKDGKKARYARADNPQEIFCSKCSIVLVGMGIKMIDAQPQPKPQSQPSYPSPSPSQPLEQSSKEKQLKHFISEINGLKSNISRQINSIQTQKSRVSYHLQEQKDDICKRYSEIIHLFKEFQARDLNLISEFQNESLRKLSEFQFQFKKSWEKIDLMIKDISPNIEMIKVHISDDQFKGFMQDYHSQVKSIIGRIDTFNFTWKEVKPYIIKRDGLDRYHYQSSTQLTKEEKNLVYFSFQRKGGMEEKETRGDEAVGIGQSIPRIQITTEQSWKREQEPFRVLFTEEEVKDQIPSPTFKRI